MSQSLEESLSFVASLAGERDRTGHWPDSELQRLAAAGAMRFTVPAEFGGEPLSALDLHLWYERLATASVAVALAVTQRDAAVGLIAGSTASDRRDGLLRRLANNEQWSTVGIAQLTTSRQGGTPALRADPVPQGHRLNGAIPWCTGGHQSQFVVVGANVPGGRQLLFVMQQHQHGVRLDPPMQLVALTQTLTSGIRLNDVLIEPSWVLRGPAEGVLGGRHTSLVLGQSFIAFGLCRAALELIREHRSPTAAAAHEKLQSQFDRVRDEVIELSQPGRETDAAAANARLRGACNELAVRITHAAVALYKGTALLLDHPAQRLAREALFLLVWSCPNPVIDCTVDLLTADTPPTNLHE